MAQYKHQQYMLTTVSHDAMFSNHNHLGEHAACKEAVVVPSRNMFQPSAGWQHRSWSSK
jgi:hypothetical protein